MITFRCVIDVLVEGNKFTQVIREAQAEDFPTNEQVEEFVHRVYGLDAKDLNQCMTSLMRSLVAAPIGGPDDGDYPLLCASALLRGPKWFGELDICKGPSLKLNSTWILVRDRTYQPYGPMASPDDKEVTTDSLKYFED